MLKLYKKYLFIPHYVQGILFLITLILGIFANRYSRYNNGPWYISNFYEVFSIYIVILIISQITAFSIMYKPLRKMRNGDLDKPKKFAGLSAMGYAFITTSYIWIFLVDLIRWYDYLDGSRYQTADLAGVVLIVVCYIATTISVLLLIINLIYYFILPSYNSKKQLSKAKSKAKFIKSKRAALQIRQLKKLLDEGIISKEVFEEKSKKYIEEL